MVKSLNKNVFDVTIVLPRYFELGLIFFRDTPNYTEKFRGIYTVGWNYRRKRPNSVGK